MAKIVIYVETCRDQLSPECTTTFHREIKRGRPQVNCNPCKSFKVKSSAAKSTGGEAVVETQVQSLDRQCGCGATFQVKAGRGRKASKCDDCRKQGKVYRPDENGELQEVKREALQAEQQKKKDEAGRKRAELLFWMMTDLKKKFNR